MHATSLFVQAARASKLAGGLEGEPEEITSPVEDGVCCLTGEECLTIPRKDLLTSSFTRLDLLERPDSDRIGIDVWDAWTWGWREAGKKRDYRPERMSAWCATESGLTLLSRQDIRRLAIDGPMEEMSCIFATTTYKKHGTLIAPVNPPGQLQVGWDDEVVGLSHGETVCDWWIRLRGMQDAGWVRPVLESLEPSLHQFRKLGAEQWTAFEYWARGRYQSPLYRFLCYLLPSQEELKETQS